MAKETNKVMQMLRDILKSKTEVVLEEVQTIIQAQDETYQAVESVMAILAEEIKE